jgi:DNA-binding MarR family transcriptional regulator
MPAEDQSAYFQLFNEIGILEQLSRTLLQAQLPDGMHVTHFAVLNHLIRVQDGQTPVELANAFQVAKTTMTHTLAGLDKAGLIVMRPNESDARSKRIWITDKGREFRLNAIRALEPEMSDLSRSFDEARVKALLPALSDLRKTLDARRDIRPSGADDR